MEQPAFTVKIGTFEGPLGLLLELIETHKFHINDVSLAAVTDSFIAHLQSAAGPTKAAVADFIVVASTLVLIKSHSLLPTLALTEEETASIDDLKRRLALYTVIREAAALLRPRFGTTPIFGAEYHAPPTSGLFVPSSDIDLPALTEAVRGLIAALPAAPGAIPEATLKRVVSLEEVIGNLGERIKQTLSLKWSEFVRPAAERVEIVVSFLGLLELVKQGLVEVRQDALFQDIAMETASQTG